MIQGCEVKLLEVEVVLVLQEKTDFAYFLKKCLLGKQKN